MGWACLILVSALSAWRLLRLQGALNEAKKQIEDQVSARSRLGDDIAERAALLAWYRWFRGLIENPPIEHASLIGQRFKLVPLCYRKPKKRKGSK